MVSVDDDDFDEGEGKNMPAFLISLFIHFLYLFGTEWSTITVVVSIFPSLYSLFYSLYSSIYPSTYLTLPTFTYMTYLSTYFKVLYSILSFPPPHPIKHQLSSLLILYDTSSFFFLFFSL